jgi:hypothetical protein
MRPITGYAVTYGPDRDIERDTTTCGHCQRAIYVKPHTFSTVFLIFDRFDGTGRPVWREEPGSACRICMRPICRRCEARDRCLVWEKKLEASEARDRLRRSVGV